MASHLRRWLQAKSYVPACSYPPRSCNDSEKIAQGETTDWLGRLGKHKTPVVEKVAENCSGPPVCLRQDGGRSVVKRLADSRWLRRQGEAVAGVWSARSPACDQIKEDWALAERDPDLWRPRRPSEGGDPGWKRRARDSGGGPGTGSSVGGVGE
ncbi:hypothetical protein NDU88_011578 [Pleurodeles waltl]|uniref:Uncharacterized protein n=1 Tax=Pleurodeles waltl TaxID=8319 RepID=A0AAV7R3E1_PLEWA|nr:hypothetical protein NDU88_011578 [Pleurodeles waltl]